MSHAMLDSVTDLVLTAYPQQSRPFIQTHLREAWRQDTYMLEYDGTELVGYLEYHRVPGTRRTIHVTELITTRPGVIWRLKRRFDALTWTHLIFRRDKTDRWRRHFRRLTHG